MAEPKTSMQDFVSHLPHSGFDLSQSLAFTAAPGMLLPIYSDLLTSGEKVTIKGVDLFARTQPMVTAAMCDVDVDIDWFFVPATMLYTAWNQIRYQTNDFITTLYGKQDQVTFGNQTGFPVISVDSCLGYYADDGNSYAFDLSKANRTAPFCLDPTAPSSRSIFLPESDFECSAKSLYRMADLLGFNPRSALFSLKDLRDGANQGLKPHNFNVFPWKGATYQCIYQNYYRNDDYEYRDIFSYNYDYLYGSSRAAWYDVEEGAQRNPSNPFILRYADLRRDYYTDVKPSPLMSSVNAFGVSGRGVDALNRVVNFLGDMNVNGDDGFGINNALNTGATVARGVGGTNANITQLVVKNNENPEESYGLFSTSNLRSLFAVEKLIRVSGRAAKTADAQILAHLGFKVPHDVKHDITKLHTSHAMLHIGEVVGTADTYNGTTGSSLGEIAGKGYVSLHDGKKVKFTAPVDGFIMAIFRAVPRIRYTGTIDRQNMLAYRTDLFIPEFDKLGMQPMYRAEITSATQSELGNSLSLERVGWQTRYQQFKRKADRATSVFDPMYYRQVEGEQVPSLANNYYSSWVVATSPFRNYNQTYGYFNYNQPYLFKCSPTMLNSIMAVPYQPKIQEGFSVTRPATMFYTDPFICDFRAHVVKVSSMSPSGEPDMISL